MVRRLAVTLGSAACLLTLSLPSAYAAPPTEARAHPESSPLWAECQMNIEGVDVRWPVNDRSLLVVTDAGPEAMLRLYLRTDSACGHERILQTAATTSGTPIGSFSLARQPTATNAYLGPVAPQLAIQIDPDADLLDPRPVPPVLHAGDASAATGVSIAAHQLRTVMGEVRNGDSITVAD